MKILELILLFALGTVDDPRPEFYQDFRNKDIAELDVKLTQPDHIKLMKSGPEGLRITMPADKRYTGAVGVLAPTPIKGDFELTATYEIIQADPPKAGFGTGLEFYMKANSPKKDGIGIYRNTRPNGNDVFSCTQMTTNEQGQRTPIRGSGHGDMDFPASGKIGQLRITRVGSKVILWAAEGVGKDFHALYDMDFVPDDLTILSLGAHPGGAPNVVDLRLLDLRVRPIDSKDPAALQTMAKAASEVPHRRSLLWVLALLVAVSLACGGLLILWAKKRGDPDGDQGEAIARAPNEVLAAPIVIQCARCGKKLKAKVELAGKKVKCSQCGQVVVVPMYK